MSSPWRWIIFGVSAAAAAGIAAVWAFGRGSGPARRVVGLFLLVIAASWLLGPAAPAAYQAIASLIRGAIAGPSPRGGATGG